jgi:hypothetical protein
LISERSIDDKIAGQRTVSEIKERGFLHHEERIREEAISLATIWSQVRKELAAINI